MKNITYVVDSGSDFESFLSEDLHYPVRVVPLHVYIEQEEYLDGVTLSKDNFYQEMALAKELPKTSQPSPQAFYDVFIEELKKGNEVLYIGITSKLSGTFQSAVIARDMLSEEEKSKVFLFDSFNVSATILFHLLKADQLLSQNQVPLREIMSRLEEYRPKIQLLALLDTLENLKKGGRVSLAQATIGGLLNIKPLVTLKDGLVENKEKFRGRKKGLRYISDLLNLPSVNKERVFIIHSYIDSSQLKEELEELDLASFKKVHYLKLGTTIGTHAGANTLGVVYTEME